MGVMLATMYNFDNSIFDGVALPDNLSTADFIDTLLAQYGEMPVLYSYPPLLKSLIATWSNTSQYTWAHLAETLKAEYNPIENYDRTETSTDVFTGTTKTNATNNATSNGTSKTQVYGYNNLTTPADDSAIATTSATNSTSDSAGTNTSTTAHDSRVHGNIGVTTSQQMLQSERDVAMFNIYDVICKDFQKRFLIWLY